MRGNLVDRNNNGDYQNDENSRQQYRERAVEFLGEIGINRNRNGNNNNNRGGNNNNNNNRGGNNNNRGGNNGRSGDNENQNIRDRVNNNRGSNNNNDRNSNNNDRRRRNNNNENSQNNNNQDRRDRRNNGRGLMEEKLPFTQEEHEFITSLCMSAFPFPHQCIAESLRQNDEAVVSKLLGYFQKQEYMTEENYGVLKENMMALMGQVFVTDEFIHQSLSELFDVGFFGPREGLVIEDEQMDYRMNAELLQMLQQISHGTCGHTDYGKCLTEGVLNQDVEQISAFVKVFVAFEMMTEQEAEAMVQTFLMMAQFGEPDYATVEYAMNEFFDQFASFADRGD